MLGPAHNAASQGRPSTRDTVVSGIIESAAGEVLMVRSAEGPWAFPSGLRRIDESFEAAMRRVAREQLGMTLDVHTGQPPLEGTHAGRRVYYRFFLAGILSGEPKPAEAVEVRWFTVAALRDLELDPLTRQVAAWYAQSPHPGS